MILSIDFFRFFLKENWTRAAEMSQNQINTSKNQWIQSNWHTLKSGLYIVTTWFNQTSLILFNHNFGPNIGQLSNWAWIA